MTEIQKVQRVLEDKRQTMFNLTQSNQIVDKDGKDFNALYKEYNQTFLELNKLLKERTKN